MWTGSIVGPIAVPLTQEWGVADDGSPCEIVTAWREGYFLNAPRALLAQRADLVAFACEPDSPQQVFAADTQDAEGRWTLTAFLRFDDEAAARAALPDYWIDAPAD